eukprot:UN09838
MAHGNLEFALSILVENTENVVEKYRPSKIAHLAKIKKNRNKLKIEEVLPHWSRNKITKR